MWLSRAVEYGKLTILLTKINIQTAMEYRMSFLLQIVGMLVTNVAFWFMWTIFFQRFHSINGWGIHNVMLLMLLSTLNLGIIGLCFHGITYLAKIIENGELDTYLLYPKNSLWAVAVSKSNIAALGDIIFGVMLYVIIGDFSLFRLLMLLTMTLITIIIMISFLVIVHSIAFWVGNFYDAADQFFIVLMFGTFTPQGSFYGALKIILCTIIPIFFVAELPVNIMTSFTIYSFLLLCVFTLLLSAIAYIVYTQGLKRYESGNLINIK